MGSQYLGPVVYGVEPYGPYFTAVDCLVTIAHAKIQCSSAPGAGKTLKLTLSVAGLNNTNPTLKYGIPEIGFNQTSFSPFNVLSNGNNFRTLSLDGGDLIELRGLNFGRPTSKYIPYELGSNGSNVDLERVTYGRLGTEYEARNCYTSYVNETMSFIQCTTVPGLGLAHQWIITVRGQKSRYLLRNERNELTDENNNIVKYATSYKRPLITRIYSTSGRPTKGQNIVILIGKHFGTNINGASYQIRFLKSSADVSATYTVGSKTLKSNYENVCTANDECISFALPEGYGTRYIDLKVTHEDYTRNAFDSVANKFVYDAPVIANVQLTDKGVEGKIKIDIAGSNFWKEEGLIYVCHNNLTAPNMTNKNLCCDENTWEDLTNSTRINECNDRNMKLIVEEWGHEQISAHVTSSMASYLYLVVGNVRSNIMKYSINGTQIVAAPYVGNNGLNASIVAQFASTKNYWYVGTNMENIGSSYKKKLYLKYKAETKQAIGSADDNDLIGNGISTNGYVILLDSLESLSSCTLFAPPSPRFDLNMY